MALLAISLATIVKGDSQGHEGRVYKADVLAKTALSKEIKHECLLTGVLEIHLTKSNHPGSPRTNHWPGKPIQPHGVDGILLTMHWLSYKSYFDSTYHLITKLIHLLVGICLQKVHQVVDLIDLCTIHPLP